MDDQNNFKISMKLSTGVHIELRSDASTGMITGFIQAFINDKASLRRDQTYNVQIDKINGEKPLSVTKDLKTRFQAVGSDPNLTTGRDDRFSPFFYLKFADSLDGDESLAVMNMVARVADKFYKFSKVMAIIEDREYLIRSLGNTEKSTGKSCNIL
jgi:hypothetical protein